jgi:SAM-dependent methyltransferase
VKRHLIRDVWRGLGSVERLRYVIAVLRQLGGATPRTCNLCGYQGLFLARGHPPRYDSECRRCGSIERHRLFGLMLDAHPALGRGRVVHFAPEPRLAAALRARAADYKSADLYMPGCDLRLDMTAIDLPDASVDFFVANHVIEHVADDRAALSELYRCLAPGGVAALTTPVIEGWRTTYDDPAIAAGESERMRILHFGWEGHLRYYGADLRDRIAQAGFALDEFVAAGAASVRHGLIRGEAIFLARKPG